jgi:hypothetical protein
VLLPPTLYTRRSILAGASACFVASAAFARRAIPDDNLLVPVLITITSKRGMSGYGSGFYLNTDNWSYLVTASHVLFPPINPSQQPFIPDTLSFMSYSNGLSANYRESISVSFQRLIDDKLIIRSSDNSDIAMIKIANIRSGTPESSQPTPTQTSPVPALPQNNIDGTSSNLTLRFFDGFTFIGTAPIIRGVSKVNTKAYKDVLIGNDALMYGYPSSLTSNMFGGQLDPLEPLLRRGLIAGINEQKKTIIVDAPAYRGNSGGPVFEIEQENFNTFFKVIGVVSEFKVIGVVSEFVPLAEGGEDIGIKFNSGYSVIAPLDGILELAK